MFHFRLFKIPNFLLSFVVKVKYCISQMVCFAVESLWQYIIWLALWENVLNILSLIFTLIYFFHDCEGDKICIFAVVEPLWMWISIGEINAITMQLQHEVFWALLLPKIITTFKMSADIYNSLVFWVSVEAAGPQLLMCGCGRKSWRTTESSVPVTAVLYCLVKVDILLSAAFNP